MIRQNVTDFASVGGDCRYKRPAFFDKYISPWYSMVAPFHFCHLNKESRQTVISHKFVGSASVRLAL